MLLFSFLTFLLLFHSLCNPLLFGFSTYFHWNLFASVTCDFPLVKSNVYFSVLINCTSGSVLINLLFLLKTFSSFEMCHFFFFPPSWARSQYISLNYIENHCPPFIAQPPSRCSPHVHLCSSVLCILCTHSIYFMHVCIALYLSYVCVCVYTTFYKTSHRTSSPGSFKTISHLIYSHIWSLFFLHSSSIVSFFFTAFCEWHHHPPHHLNQTPEILPGLGLSPHHSS